ncbi:MAG: tRNA 2-thiocytidine(32) synthetase TtcA [Lachnospiraceae bacterium]|nr:tRNA 2-thiocytidine(32) synthetase TtcA [Lachnospiraceae bacterium]
MNLQKLLSYTRRAVDDYQMIAPNDRIAVGVSGGKDSLALLYALHGLKRFYPNPFFMEAITVAVFPEMDVSPIREVCRELDVPYTVVPTEIGEIVFQERKEENPCSLCAKMRKGAFNEQARALGCNKVAYAHHKDDIVETMLMSLIFEGRFHSFSPYTYLDRMDLTVIRPLLYVPEADLLGFKNQYHLPVCKNPCPADGQTKREYAKNLVRQLNHENPGAKERMFTAILNGGFSGWPERSSRH